MKQTTTSGTHKQSLMGLALFCVRNWLPVTSTGVVPQVGSSPGNYHRWYEPAVY